MATAPSTPIPGLAQEGRRRFQVLCVEARKDASCVRAPMSSSEHSEEHGLRFLPLGNRGHAFAPLWGDRFVTLGSCLCGGHEDGEA